MFYTIADDLILYQMLSFIKKFSNLELKLLNYFSNKTNGIFPELVITINHFIFFFVKSESYFSTKEQISSIRRDLRGKKVLIIRVERILINLLFSFFPDVYVHNIQIDTTSRKREISLYFFIAEDRGIAIGRNGDYIKAVNYLFENYIKFDHNDTPLLIKCKNIK
jgi:hypothetical protein